MSKDNIMTRLKSIHKIFLSWS